MMWSPLVKRVGHLRSWFQSLLQPLLAVCVRFRVVRRVTTVLLLTRPWRHSAPWTANTVKVGWPPHSACLCWKSLEEALSASARVTETEGSAWRFGVSFMKTLVFMKCWRVKFCTWLRQIRTANGVSVRCCVQILLLFFICLHFTRLNLSVLSIVTQFISALCRLVSYSTFVHCSTQMLLSLLMVVGV